MTWTVCADWSLCAAGIEVASAMATRARLALRTNMLPPFGHRYEARARPRPSFRRKHIGTDDHALAQEVTWTIRAGDLSAAIGGNGRDPRIGGQESTGGDRAFWSPYAGASSDESLCALAALRLKLAEASRTCDVWRT